MRVLLDENLPHDLAILLTGHDVSTVQGLGWAGVENGELLQRASGRVDAFLTMDRNLERQQTLTDLAFGIIVISTKTINVSPFLTALGAAELDPRQTKHES